MSAENWHKIKAAFAEASVLAPDDRLDFARRQFSSDAAAFDELKKLLDSLDDAAEFFEEPIFAADRSYAGQKIGNYRIVREIGRGGMGVVLLGTREGGEFEQQVAIKILKRGIDSDEIVDRFNQERRILASLHHSNIAGLLDGGTTDAGLPYFVMEFIDGLPLMRFCEQNGASESVKIRLFREVCSAVSYAHTRLIVHRDLKPSNILVTADGLPKLLDFGIAKLLDEGNGARLTQTSNRMLTPEYASPEQVRGDPITTASDVYSLGVILYELLTGKLPYNFKTRSAEETFRLICDEDPIPMDRTTVARIDPDLKNIVLFALRKEPERRYSTVEAFSNDIDRFTNGLPISARRNTFKYRAQKYLKRHTAAAIASLLVILTVILGIAATLRQARIAQAEKVRSQTVSTFLQNMLDNWDPEATNLSEQDREITVKDVLDSASDRIANGELSDQPEVRAELEEIIGNRYMVLGKYDLAEKNLRDSVDLTTGLYGESDIRTNKVMGEWASLLMSKSDFADSEAVFRKVLPILKSESAKGNVDVEEVVLRMSDFAVLRRAQGDSKEAETILREVVALQPLSTFPKDKNPTAVLDGMSTLALTLSDQGRVSEALVMEHQVMAALEENGLAHTPTYGYSLTGIGGYLCQQGKFSEADDALRRAEAIYRGVFAADHLSIGDNLRIQADSLYLQGNYPAAEAKIDETLRIYRKSSGPKYINLPIAMTIKGSILAKTGRTAEAEQMLREAVALRAESMPENHFLVAMAKMALGDFLTSRGRYDEAEQLLLKSFESLKVSQAPESPRLSLARSYLINLYQAWNKPELARHY
jgi:serine/threonine protein kinase/Flp pilus assembly protein TadD